MRDRVRGHEAGSLRMPGVWGYQRGPGVRFSSPGGGNTSRSRRSRRARIHGATATPTATAARATFPPDGLSQPGLRLQFYRRGDRGGALPDVRYRGQDGPWGSVSMRTGNAGPRSPGAGAGRTGREAV